MKRDDTISPFIAFGGLILLMILPLCDLPVAVPGIPVWYQDMFFWGLLAMGIVGEITWLQVAILVSRADVPVVF